MYIQALQDPPHQSVMLEEALYYLNPEPGKIYVDCTFGAGGYSKAILNKADCNLFAIDRDPDVEKFANIIAKDFSKFKFSLGKFSEISSILNSYNISKVDGIILDLGVSSMQLDTRSRGFSFMESAYLDMRMGKEGRDAAYVVNNYTEQELADIIYYFGDEKDARKIARKICNEREKAEIATTEKLAEIIRSVKSKKYSKIDPATKTFQAFRIYVNDELEELKTIINQVDNLLNENGRLVIVSFHSLEDKIVKDFINIKLGKNRATSRHVPIFNDDFRSNYISLTKGAGKPSEDEVKSNPRSRSARLRAIEKIGNA
ncbi:MAG: 16S rRNA (cytosine(1402)-N(4))-methyltransferase RsmH [Alphaproteobacteria bacterium]